MQQKATLLTKTNGGTHEKHAYKGRKFEIFSDGPTRQAVKAYYVSLKRNGKDSAGANEPAKNPDKLRENSCIK